MTVRLRADWAGRLSAGKAVGLRVSVHSAGLVIESDTPAPAVNLATVAAVERALPLDVARAALGASRHDSALSRQNGLAGAEGDRCPT